MPMLQNPSLVPTKGLPSKEYDPPDDVELVTRASTTGQLNDVQKICSEYLAKQFLDQKTDHVDLRIFSPTLVAAVANNHPAIVAYLLDIGFPIPSLPTWEAVEAESSAIFQVYIDYGWDINKPMSRIKPPALGFVLDNRELIEWFLNHDANPNAMCAWDFTPLSLAVHHASLAVIKLLFEHGGSIGRGQLLHHAVKREASDTLEVLSFLLGLGAHVNEIKYQNHEPSYRERWLFGLGTPLHKAAELGKVDVVSFLLEHGADHTIKDSKGKTAFDLATARGHSEIIRLLEN